MPTNLDPHMVQYILVGAFISALSTVLLVAVQVMTLVRSRATQKREVTIDGGYVNKHEFEQFVQASRQEIANLFSKLGGVERGGQSRLDERFETLRNEFTEAISANNRQSEIRAVELHSRLNPMEKQLGALEAQTEILNQRLVQMDAKLDRAIERRSA